MPGRFRRLKWLVASIYLLYFIGPYLRWDGRQALLLDIPARKYHIFSLTIWPQDVWMLSLLLLTFFITLFAATTIAGRVFCGYVCWQTVWTDVYTLIEEWIEGPPAQRRALDKAPWSLHKLRVKAPKQAAWLVLSGLTGITFTAYFMDVFELWGRYFSLEGPVYIWVTPLPFMIGSYIGAGFMREQICFWLCPYARIQGVMTDPETLMPTYDNLRGEPRGKLVKCAMTGVKNGDCIDCNLCVAVCPTGIDIRNGQQEGCITCALCVDACDTVMEKTGRPTGLVRYMSLKESHGEAHRAAFKRPRVLIYSAIVIAAISGVIYGATHLAPMTLTVIHERQPLFVTLSDGSIQNSYTVKILNKTDKPMEYRITASGVDGLGLDVMGGPVARVEAGKVAPVQARIRVPKGKMAVESAPVYFEAESLSDSAIGDRYESVFISPKTGG
ncbi:MAG: cytochrome c oxidase accessory protein CcoG [Nitrospinae bacterium]|nr:cytochrome c oxidase accessory protein CcoG [Nitrospinota bacterium]